MKKIFYEKIGRRYVPIKEYDSEFLDAFPKGNHLVMVYPGGSSRRFNIDPNHAALIAAGRVAEDAISKVLVKAGELRMQRGKVPLTEGQRNAWENLVKEFGDEARQLEWPSAREAVEAGVGAMIEEAEKLMSVPAVKKAYDRFVLVAELTKDQRK